MKRIIICFWKWEKTPTIIVRLCRSRVPFFQRRLNQQPGGPAQGAGHASSPANFHIKHVVIEHGHYTNIFLTHQHAVVLVSNLGAVLAEL